MITGRLLEEHGWIRNDITLDYHHICGKCIIKTNLMLLVPTHEISDIKCPVCFSDSEKIYEYPITQIDATLNPILQNMEYAIIEERKIVNMISKDCQ